MSVGIDTLGSLGDIDDEVCISTRRSTTSPAEALAFLWQVTMRLSNG